MTTLLKRGLARLRRLGPLQTMIYSSGGWPRLSVDGDFGPTTDRTMPPFQQEHGLVVDGLASRQASPPSSGR